MTPCRPLIAALLVTLARAAAAQSTMVFQTFDGTSVPLNREGVNYPLHYVGNGEGGVFSSSIDTVNRVLGTGSLKMVLTSGTGLYAQ